MLKKICLYLFSGLVTTGCQIQTAAESQWQPSLLLSTNQCGLHQAGVQWVTDTSTLPDLMGPVAETLLDKLNGGEQTPAEGGLLLVAAGIQPNPGYGLEFLDADFINGQAVLKLNWKAPDPEHVYPMVRVSPCLLIGLPNKEAGELLVLDQLDKERYRLSLW